MKNILLVFAIGLLACAGMRETGDITSGSFGDNGSAFYSGEPGVSLLFDSDSSLLIKETPPDSSMTWVDETIGEIYGFRVPTEIGNGGFIIATPSVPYVMSAKDSMLLATLLNAPVPDKMADERNSQKFSVHVNITFPKMTLQQAAELEARLKKLLPEAMEINLDLGQDVDVPVGEFYFVPDGAESRTVPGFYSQGIEILPDEMKNFYLPPTAPLKGLRPGKVLKIDSTDVPVWQ